MHLKVIQTMQKIPRSLGIPPLSDSGFDQALTTQANALASSSGFTLGDDEGKINPLAGMGLTDEQYNAMLQNIVNGDALAGDGGFGSGDKRGREEDNDGGPDGKRPRFEVIE